MPAVRQSPTGKTRWTEEDCGYSTPCWVWQMAVTPNGYGVVFTADFRGGAHRYLYEQTVGPIPKGAVIDHLCRNRRCVNPDHMETVRQAENVRRGPLARLSERQADEIRALAFSGSHTQREIGARYGVTQQTVSDIKRSRRWATPGGVL